MTAPSSKLGAGGQMVPDTIVAFIDSLWDFTIALPKSTIVDA